MNNRDYKQFAPGSYYHIYNRGNGKMDIFLGDDDFRFFIFRLRQNLFPDEEHSGRITLLPPQSFSLISYCLMPNHFHFLLRQERDIPTSKLLTKVCTSYSKYFNKKYERVGHLFQDQFKQILVDENSYLIWLSAYIHQNPKVSGLITNLADYKWSSYPDLVGLRDGGLCDKSIIMDQFKSPKDFEIFVESSHEVIKNRKDIEALLLD